MQYSRYQLTQIGFKGWDRWDNIANWDCPTSGGVYVVHYFCEGLPDFLPESSAGWFKGKNPSVPAETLTANWVDEVSIIYIGKANNLRRRLQQYARFGAGKPVGHWGGRLIWQLPDAHNMLVAWRETPDEVPRTVEKRMIGEFRKSYGKPPFANDPHRLGK
ncbi:GIY-YIG domain-containing protein [Ruegeria atlantica]|uniref:GIY-YIG domain-containing protein n=1 Tax=Ruegeria atlantica TaxID=81569 RepID=UPI00148034A2|nr:hypothetical protein [Ruegeria atlantica]